MDLSQLQYWENVLSEISFLFHWIINTAVELLPYSPLILISLVAFLIAGVVKGITGLGMPITAITILSLVAEPRYAITLVVLPIIITNLLQTLSRSRQLPVLRSYSRLIVSMAIVTACITSVIHAFPVSVINLLMGTSILAYVTFTFINKFPHIPSHYIPHSQYATGIATGFLGGTTGLIVVPIAMYLSMLRLERHEFIAVSCPMFMLGGIFMLASFTSVGLLTPHHTVLSFVMVFPALIGVLIGESIGQYLSEKVFRLLTFVFFTLSAVTLFASGFAQLR